MEQHVQTRRPRSTTEKHHVSRFSDGYLRRMSPCPSSAFLPVGGGAGCGPGFSRTSGRNRQPGLIVVRPTGLGWMMGRRLALLAAHRLHRRWGRSVLSRTRALGGAGMGLGFLGKTCRP